MPELDTYVDDATGRAQVLARERGDLRLTEAEADYVVALVNGAREGERMRTELELCGASMDAQNRQIARLLEEDGRLHELVREAMPMIRDFGMIGRATHRESTEWLTKARAAVGQGGDGE